MDPIYFTTATTNFGPAEWVFFLASCAVLCGGIYLGLLRTDQNAIRLQALRQLGYVLLGVGGTGILIGLIRLVGVAIAPLWFTIVTVALLAVAAYAAYLVLVQLPQRIAAAQAQSRARNTARQAPAQRVQTPAARVSDNGTPVTATSGGRRESRRERKRRNK